MKKRNLNIKIFTCTLIFGFALNSCNQNTLKIDDTFKAFAQANAPVSVKVELSKSQRVAATEGRLGLVNPSINSGNLIPAQLENEFDSSANHLNFILPEEELDLNEFNLIESDNRLPIIMKAQVDSHNGQVIVEEAGEKILQYNYSLVTEKDVVSISENENEKSSFSELTGIYLEEYLKENPGVKKRENLSTSVYAVPRSNYIHPIFGLEGEMLTRDWPDGGHPHHRGVFWAWPEVEFGSQRGDIYALQRIFARPTGNIKYFDGPVFAQIEAENLWMWEDSIPIVNENAIIRVYRATSKSRIIDLTIKFVALKDSITIATRGTNSYGGLNIRMQTPESQEISYFTNETDPIEAWSDFNGIFKGAESTSGLMVLQHKDNPEYPGVWQEYPDLAWVQPTFPTPGTRYKLNPEEPLILRYRLVVHKGGNSDAIISKLRWSTFNDPHSPQYYFDKVKN